MSKTTGYLDRARKRQIESPGWNWRRYLRKAGRRDGRKNIPDLEGDGWPTGVIQETRKRAGPRPPALWH